MESTGGYAGCNYTPEEIEIDDVKIDLNNMSKKDIKIIIQYCEIRLTNNLDFLESISKTIKNKEKYIERVKELIDCIKNITNELLEDFDNRSKQFQKLIGKIYKHLYNTTTNVDFDEQFVFESNSSYFLDEIEREIGRISNIIKLDFFSKATEKNGLLIIGSNGSGKSSFMSFLKEFYEEDMILIPAQKLLIYSDSIQNIITKQEDDIKVLQNENIIQTLRFSYQDIQSNSVILNFSTLITAIANKTISEQNNYCEKRRKYKSLGKLHELEELETVLDKINEVWALLIDNISFSLNTEEHSIEAVTAHGEKYNINSMSDGEKAILYYIGNIMMAKKDSYIVVDEPETHLNSSIYKKLWDTLEENRSDCQFIYISHNMEFIKTRHNTKIVWMRKYYHPNKWDFEFIEESDNFPKQLMIEICGSKNRIIFCEGEKGGIDHSIYSSVFGKEYSIIPVGSCINVCNYTETLNKIPTFSNYEAIGIIDNDNKSEQDIKQLQDRKIFTTKYNEIEMLLCDEKVIEEVLNIYGDDKTEKIKKFKDNFFAQVKKQKEAMALQHVKNTLNETLTNYRLNCTSIDAIETELTGIVNIVDYEAKYNNYINRIDSAIENNNYEEILKICNLKKEITKGLANKELDSDYEVKAINAIRYKLTSYVKEKYFYEISHE